MILLALAAPYVHAFCGTFVGSAEDPPQNEASEVAIVRAGDTTTLTVSNDVHGDTSKFAMVIPVPEVLPEEAIHVVAPEVFTTLEGYSTPRLVSYSCADFETDADTDSDVDSDVDYDTADTGGVEVEANYVVGEYDVTILSATESNALVDWLQRNGYQVPDASASLLGEYIDGGAYFFAAQVREDAGIEDGATLSPLQFTYTAPMLGLPIRIGTLNSPGSQDLRVYAINAWEEGRVGIANYDEVVIEDECMTDAADFGAFYFDELDEAFSSSPDAQWVTEYAWGGGHCDPCTGETPSAEDLLTLGWTGDPYDFFFTRLRMRYTPDQAGEDLVLYHSRDTSTQQIRYIQYMEELEDRFPVCGLGMVEDPGSCFGDGVEPGDDEEPHAEDDGEIGVRGYGCATVPAASALATALALALARRRR